MVDFSKLVGQKRVVDFTNHLNLFQSLDRQASHTTLRPDQTKVLEEIRPRRNERDLILKMSTGAGKTTVALLYLKSYMIERGLPGVYLCPNIQLVNQILDEASKIGIDAIHYRGGESHPGADAMSGRSVIVCTYNKLFNAKSTFDRDDVLLRPCAIVLDDAHAGVEEIRESFTLTLIDNKARSDLLKLVSPICEKYMPGKWSDILGQDPDEFLEIPYWIWKPILDEIQKKLSPYSDENDFRFVWPYLRDHLRWCRCIVSGAGIEMIPDILPINLVKAFWESPHRLFMSATLADDSVLVRELGCEPQAAQKPIFSGADTGIGERMVLAPSLVDKRLSRGWIMKWCQNLSRKVNVVVLSPSEKSARDWEKVGAVFSLGDDVEATVKNLRIGSIRFAVFAQRYDGVDLPDNACRILVIDGMPYGQGITDKYDSRKMGIPGGFRNRLIYRIEQGMGRAVRSEADYAVIILSGDELANFIAKREVLDLMNPGTRVQLELALELARVALQESEGEPGKTLTGILNNCLNRDEGWKQFYDERVRKVAKISITEKNRRNIELADAEHRAAHFAMSRNSGKAIEIIENAISKLCEDEKEKGWFLQKSANYMHELDPGKAMELQRFAYEKNRTTFCPPEGIILRPPDFKKSEDSVLVLKWYSTFANPNGAIAELETLRVQLSFEGRPKTVEQAIMDLFRIMGAEGSRPEDTLGRGPDDLWIWPEISLVIEVKNEREKALPKKDAGQLLDSLEWFKKNYSPRLPIPVIIAKGNSAEKDAHFPEGSRVLTPDKMKKLLDNLSRFVAELIKKPPKLWKVGDLITLRAQHKLLPEHFVNNYTLPMQR